jgi:DNA (cytosine-5)-methyltransferase 1
MKIVSLFSGCGGLDLGFEKSGFDIIWANEYDKTIWETFEKNFPKTKLNKKSIVEVESSEVPDCNGIIGGPPCQSWSEAGAGRGINDHRGKLFYEYIRILKDKKPDFFLAENVSGILSARHRDAFSAIIKGFEDLDYKVTYKLVNANDYGVPEDRHRVIVIGYHKRTGKKFEFPEPINQNLTLKDAIWDLKVGARQALDKNKANENLKIPNHEYMNGGFSTMFMSRNRVRSWDQPSFTIQAGGRHAPLHPQANKMIKEGENKFVFDENSKKPYRRLSVRECGRVQTFPDSFIWTYRDVADGYKMIGNAVPVKLARTLAKKIYQDLYS